MTNGTLHSNHDGAFGRAWRFVNCEFDELRYELRVKGVVLQLEVKPREVLHQLLLRPGEVLTKEELLEAVWPGLTVVDGSLTTAISKLRKALGNEAIVITVPRVGYRLGVPVEVFHPVPVHPPQPPRPRWKLLFAPVLFLATLGVFLLYPRSSAKTVRPASVAVLPFQNATTDTRLDFLRFAFPDELVTTLSHMRPLTVRPFSSASKFTGSVDLAAASRDLGASQLVTGRYVASGDHIQVTMEAMNVADNRLLWRDTFNVPANDLLAMQEQVAAVARGKLAPALGATQLERNDSIPPKNAEAYSLYLRSLPIAFDPVANREGEALLERVVQLDPTYAPAWNLLALRYYAHSRWDNGGEPMLDRSDAASERAMALDASSLDALSELTVHRTERGELVRSYRTARELIQRRPDVGVYHHTLSYVLRYGGDLPEAGRQCEMAVMLDPEVLFGSCSTTFMELGDYSRAMNFIRKDLSSEWSKAHAIEILLRERKYNRVLEIGAPKVPQWPSYGMLMACVQHAPEREIARLAASVHADVDPEVDYLFAGHLAYCGQEKAAFAILKTAIAGGYCSYPAMDTDPLFVNARRTPEFAQLRAAGEACHQRFLTERNESVNRVMSP